MTIAVTPDRVYRYWRELQNLPAFMERITAVTATRQSAFPLGGARAARADDHVGSRDRTEDRPNECLRWRSVADAVVSNAGSVTFRAAPGDRGTELCVELTYVPPAGDLGRAASFFSNKALAIQLERDLRRLKQVLELGEIVQSDASVHRGPHPARPAQS